MDMRSYESSRMGLRVSVCALLGLLTACSDRSVEEIELPAPHEPHGPEPVVLRTSRAVDVLLVVGNSATMDAAQSRLVARIGLLLDALELLEVSDYRIGITTTDDGHPLCEGTTPQEGMLQATSCLGRPGSLEDGSACLTHCPPEWADIALQPSGVFGQDGLVPRPWIESIAGRTNLPPGLSPQQALACMIPQGTAGCRFTAPLESMRKALLRSTTESDPGFGFIREHAVLAVVHLTDAADCSYSPEWETVFLPEGDRQLWSDPEATSATPAVCWNAGVVCEGSGAGGYDDCAAVDVGASGNEVSSRDRAVLHPMSRYIDALQDIEDDKQRMWPEQQVLVSLIAGVGPDGGVTYQDATDPLFGLEHGIGPGCTDPLGSAVPPVRMRALAERFAVGDQPNVFSICEPAYGAALEHLAAAIAEQLPPACMSVCVADSDPSTPDVLDPSCRVWQEVPNAAGGFDERDVVECDAAGGLPVGEDVCYVPLTGDARSEGCRDTGFNLELELVRREGVPGPEGELLLASCDVSQDRAVDCPGLG